jgi:thiol:disulfide interchange protein DsbD
MRVLAFVFSFVFLFSAPLPENKAFHSKFELTNKGVEFELKIAKGVHVYQKSIKILVNDKPLHITLPPPSKDKFGDKVYFDELKFIIPKIGKISVRYQGCSDLVCYAPKVSVFTPKTKLKNPNKNIPQKIVSNEDKIVKLFNKSIWIILGSFFLFGILLSLTPCVFPMIPILTGLIVKVGGDGKITPLKGLFISFVYVFSMSIAYTIAGVLAGFFGGNIQAMLQNPYVLGVFSAIFVLLALSMFGFFEIGIPASLQTKLSIKSDKAGQKGGLIGVALMGFFSALIVGPCVAPPLAGALIYIGQTGNAFLGGSALFVMSFGMGVPLFLVGLGAGKFMPKAGNWMIGINRVFGVIMLGVAIWMISRVVSDYVTTLLWSVLAIGSGLYLNPFSKMENYKQVIVKTIGFFLVLIGSVLVFRLYVPSVASNQYTNIRQYKSIKNISELNKVINNNPNVIVDFSAKWCVACKEYEKNTFSNPLVLRELQKYAFCRVDVTSKNKEESKLLERFHLVGPPAVLVFKNGKLVAKIIGYKPPKEFLRLLNESNKK